jgi:hypothetical protein
MGSTAHAKSLDKTTFGKHSRMDRDLTERISARIIKVKLDQED